MVVALGDRENVIKTSTLKVKLTMQNILCVIDHQIILVNNSTLPNNINDDNNCYLLSTYLWVRHSVKCFECCIFFNPHNKFMEMNQCYIHSAYKDTEVTELRKWWQGICSVPLMGL